MSVKDQYIDLCEARVEALLNEIRLHNEYLIRQANLNGLSAQAALDLFKAFKDDETKI
jgi:hypothetical protein